ncbi:MAG TPA: CAP domain-containing protein [Pyrinomonadaceae bacterium]|nr:CAP domain-containing protein [Pyrinomonadaceae bacterium]
MRNKQFAVTGSTQSSFHTATLKAFILTLAILVSAVAVQAQTAKQPKPVPRLVSSSRQVVPQAPRPRLIASIPVSQIPDMNRDANTRAASTGTSYSSGATFAGASSLERRAFELINSERRQRGESPLQWDAELSQLARQHSLNMARSGALGHTGPDGRGMAERARAAGIRGWQVLGENVAFNQGFNDPSAFAVERWMGSSKHRANILNRQFTRTGIGVARAADGSIYFTQVFVN